MTDAEDTLRRQIEVARRVSERSLGGHLTIRSHSSAQLERPYSEAEGLSWAGGRL
jgi:hypothetical protein